MIDYNWCNITTSNITFIVYTSHFITSTLYAKNCENCYESKLTIILHFKYVKKMT